MVRDADFREFSEKRPQLDRCGPPLHLKGLIQKNGRIISWLMKLAPFQASQLGRDIRQGIGKNSALFGAVNIIMAKAIRSG